MTFSVLVHCCNIDRPNLGQERSDSYAKRGDIYDVRPLNAQYGRRESLRRWLDEGLPRDEFPVNFVIVRVRTGSVPADEIRAKLVRNATRPATVGEPEFIEPDLSGDVVTHQHVWRLRFSEFTSEENNVFDDVGELTITQSRFSELSEHKVTRTRFDPSEKDGYGAVRPDADEPLPREEMPNMEVRHA